MSSTSLLPVEDAIARIADACPSLPTEMVPLADAGGRVLAAPLTATRTQPPFDGSAMDGYAVRFADVATVPVTLPVVGTSAAGSAFNNQLATGQAARIFTGAPVPSGADSVVIQENTTREGDNVTILVAPREGQNIRRAGGDFRDGDCYLSAGRVLSNSDIALAAAMNIPKLSVYRRPRVAFFATGDELVLPGETPGPDQIISSNSAGLSILIRELGGEPVDLGIARDTEESIRAHATRGLDADILLTIGGASVGDYDLVQPVLKSMGLEMDFWKIAMRPGKPLMFGKLGTLPFIGLPGNPVSALICAQLFLRAAIDASRGRPAAHPVLQPVFAGTDLKENDQRQDYLRAKLRLTSGGAWAATPFPVQDSSLLTTLSASDCLIVRTPHAPAVSAGEIVPALILRTPNLSTE
ncbi:MAG: molybdopterin molybdenumtransferase MoeA [Rhodobiaceae bacterium]|nr:molybdopterin molybdenumtransferase MoeA [Rhodobiaceae bacterium]